LSILKLPADILKEVGISESCQLKFTHAVALAYLTRTDRSQKNSEIMDLAAKAIRHQLTTVELKMLVKLRAYPNNPEQRNVITAQTK